MDFLEAKKDFDRKYSGKDIIPKSLVLVNGKVKDNIRIRNEEGEELEEYYKWQFIYALLHSGLFKKDYICVEAGFPKGSTSSKLLTIDAVIFDSKDWVEHYKKAHAKSRDQDSINYLRKHLIGVIEFKKELKKVSDLTKVINEQLRPALKESDADFTLGIYYDKGRLYLFKSEDKNYVRLDDRRNLNYSQRVLERLSLELPDHYFLIPSFTKLCSLQMENHEIEYSKLKATELDTIEKISDVPIKIALSNILKKMDRLSLVNEEGYQILIQTMALRIFDEKDSIKHNLSLNTYILPEELEKSQNLSDSITKNFINRLKSVLNKAIPKNPNLFNPLRIDWKKEKHILLISEVLSQFQNYSFALSESSDLYQMVFYNFATKFKKDEKAQFLTPIPIIDFIVRIIKPKSNETIMDPCMGIGDFLSIAYVNSNKELDDSNIYGVDIDEQMTILANLNMILNGDGNAILKTAQPPTGSIAWKFDSNSDLVKLIPSDHNNGNWDNWSTKTKLMKFNIVLTNPPFGRGRSYEVKNNTDKEIIEMYELWNKYRRISPSSKDDIDLGIVFLENAYRILEENGRLGIVLSKSISTTTEWKFVIDWIVEKMRIVALIELPADIFAETGVPVNLLFAYKASEEELKNLKEQNYSIFTREIKKIGYHKKTVKRNVIFETDYKINLETFEVETDEYSKPIVDEEFTKVIEEFKEWSMEQEETLQKLFL